jgi:hypothetical protein
MAAGRTRFLTGRREEHNNPRLEGIDVRLRFVAPVLLMIALIAGAFAVTRIESLCDGVLVPRSSPRTRRGHRVFVGVVIVALTVGVGGCVALIVVGGPCAFDPPPGDMGSPPVVNDTTQTVNISDCASSACASERNQGAVREGRSIAWQYERCNGNSVGITDTTGRLLGCLTMPIGEPPKITYLRVSNAQPCS